MSKEKHKYNRYFSVEYIFIECLPQALALSLLAQKINSANRVRIPTEAALIH